MFPSTIGIAVKSNEVSLQTGCYRTVRLRAHTTLLGSLAPPETRILQMHAKCVSFLNNFDRDTIVDTIARICDSTANDVVAQV